MSIPCAVLLSILLIIRQNDWMVGCQSMLAYTKLALTIRYRTAMVFAIQQWLAETPESRKHSQTPGYFAVGMSGKNRFCVRIVPVLIHGLVLGLVTVQSCSHRGGLVIVPY